MGESKVNHAGTAAVLSFVFNGLGQIYNGEIHKGLTIIFFSFASLVIFIFGSTLIGLWLLEKISLVGFLVLGIGLFIAGLLAICFIGIYSIFDAYNFSSRG